MLGIPLLVTGGVLGMWFLISRGVKWFFNSNVAAPVAEEVNNVVAPVAEEVNNVVAPVAEEVNNVVAPLDPIAQCIENFTAICQVLSGALQYIKIESVNNSNLVDDVYQLTNFMQALYGVKEYLIIFLLWSILSGLVKSNNILCFNKVLNSDKVYNIKYYKSAAFSELIRLGRLFDFLLVSYEQLGLLAGAEKCKFLLMKFLKTYKGKRLPLKCFNYLRNMVTDTKVYMKDLESFAWVIYKDLQRFRYGAMNFVILVNKTLFKIRVLMKKLNFEHHVGFTKMLKFPFFRSFMIGLLIGIIIIIIGLVYTCI
jgi:hypothetical protein